MSLVSFAGLLKVRGSSEVFPSGPFHGGLVSKPNIHSHRQTDVCRMYTIKPTGTPGSHTKSYNLLANDKKKSCVTGTQDVVDVGSHGFLRGDLCKRPSPRLRRQVRVAAVCQG